MLAYGGYPLSAQQQLAGCITPNIMICSPRILPAKYDVFLAIAIAIAIAIAVAIAVARARAITRAIAIARARAVAI